MRRTRQKLDEAAFFLGKVEEHSFDFLDDDEKAPPFIYYVSAFVSAARSVQWVMRSECVHSEGWEEWFQSREPAVEDRELLRNFAKIRNRSEKSDPLHPAVKLYASVGSEASADEGGRPPSKNPKLQQYRITITEVAPESEQPCSVEAVLDAVQFGLPELGEGDFLHCCSRYLGLLKGLVEDCEARFSNSAA